MIVLHPGTHKTGTSSLQSFLAKKRKELSVNEWCYSKISQNHSGPVSSLFKDNPFKYYYYKKHLSLSDYCIFLKNNEVGLKLSSELRDNKNLIISGESLSFLSVDELYRMKCFLSEFQSEIRIVLYYREPASYMCSAIQQHLKSGVSITRVLNNPPKYHFDIAYNNYKSVFGEECCVLRCYEKRINGSVIDDFINVLNLPIKNNNENLINANVSFGRYTCYIINAMIIAGEDFHSYTSIEDFNRLDGTSLKFELKWKSKLKNEISESDFYKNCYNESLSADWDLSVFVAEKIIEAFKYDDFDIGYLRDILMSQSKSSIAFVDGFLSFFISGKKNRLSGV